MYVADHKNEVKVLKAAYKRRSLLKPLPWFSSIQLPLEDVYTRLKICSRRKTDFRLENVVDFCDIFESLAKGEDTMVLVEGSPGIGKTTFCLKVAYDWAKEKPGNESLHVLHEFEFVLLLKCRDIEGDLMEAISEQLLPEDMDQKAKDEFIDYIKDVNHQERILIILDGLDELPEKSKDHVDKLLNRRILPFCFVLATCRQEKGISVRTEFSFDVLLQIEGFTKEDAFKYITKHFTNVCPEQTLNVEKLIQQIQENASLHVLCTNPLNILLLCVVFEDYEEKLPSSRTKLYQIIVHCLLRRYCSKHNMKASDDDSALEQQFQESLLVLGQLAWKCLLTDRHCFPEAELIKFESLNKDLAARFLGLVFKEASLKRIKPQHEYHYLHKTFQEYLAALYLVHLLLKEQINVFECFELEFCDVVTKYRQVFLFVIGVLEKEASTLFRQMGEVLLNDEWDWLECREDEATFFTESFSESGNAEQMAVTLCTYCPFPLDIEIDNSFYSYPDPCLNFLSVLKTCKTFSQLQLPLSLSLLGADSLEDDEVDTFKDALVSCLPFNRVNISGNEMKTSLATALCEGLYEANSTLTHFSLYVLHSIPAYVAEIIGKALALNQTLTTVVFTLTAEWGEAWASALEKGLSAETPLASVVLGIDCSMSDTAIQALVTKVLLNKSLLSLALIVTGEMQDLLASAVSAGLAAVTVLKSFTLVVYGKMTSQGAISLQNGFLKNHSLHSLVVRVFGELPNNWTNVVQNVFLAKQSLIHCDFHPNPISQVTDAQINHLNSVVLGNGFISDYSLTLNLWGELNGVGAEALGKLLEKSCLSTLTLNVQGKLADGVARCLAKYLKPHRTLSSVTVNTWCELTEEGRAVLQGVSKTQIHSFALDYQNKPSQDSFSQSHIPSVNGPSELRAIFDNAKESHTRTLNLTINNHSDTGEDWARGLSDGLAKNPSLITLTLTINNFSDASEDWAHGLSDGLATNSSVTALYLIINNFSGMSGKWGYTLGNVFAKFASLTELSLLVADHSTSAFEGNLANSLLMNTSLTTLRITINCGVMTTFWKGLGDCLKHCVSLTTLTLTVNNFSDMSRDWTDQLDIDLAKSTSITTLNLVVNNYCEMWGTWGDWLRGCLAGNASLTTLSLTFNNYNQCNDDSSGEWAYGLAYGLANNATLTTLCLAISDYNNTNGEWAYRLREAWVDNASLTTLTLRVNNVACSEVRGDWLQGLFNRLSKSESLATLKFTVNNQGAVGGNIACNFDLCNCLAKCRSLTSLDVTVSLYGVAN